MPPEASYLGGQSVGQRLEAPLERSARRRLSILLEQKAKRSHLGGRLGQHAKQLGYGVQVAHDHDDQGLEEEPVGVHAWSAGAAFFGRFWGVGRRSTRSTRVTSKPCWPIIAATSTSVVLVW